MMTEEKKLALIARCNYLIGGAPEIDVQLAEFALAALTQRDSPDFKLREGWKLVPVEPTEDMIVDGFESEPDEIFSDAKVWEEYDAMSGCQQAAHRALLCWRAMLSAAPDVPHTAQIEPICATGGAEWVKCSERMPEDFQDVLVTDGSEVKICWFNGEFWDGPFVVGGVETHWQPLPAPPKS